LCHIPKLLVSIYDMRKLTLITITLCVTIFNLAIAQQPVSLITTDIDNFWQAYDKIVKTKDSVAQYDYLKRLFLDRATVGQKAMIQARRYTSKDYVDAINQRQSYFNTIRKNTYKAEDYAKEIGTKIEVFRKLYPPLKPAKLYFTIGAFRSGGTTLNDMVLIGSEIAMAGEHLSNLVFTNVHEYVHTQQKSTSCDYLLGQSVMEGVAEFVTEKVMGTSSTLPAIAYGKQNEEKVRQAFASHMFNIDYGFWLYNDVENEFGLRDLGYYVGYTIAEAYYNRAEDKTKAIKEMIEVDANDEQALAAYVDQSGYFNRSVELLKQDYEKSRPKVLSVYPFETGKLISPSTSRFTIQFSAPMNKRSKNFELGPLGMDYLIRVKTFIGFSADGKSLEFEMEQLKPNKHYQLLIGQGFRDLNDKRIKPYLIDFRTGEF
jgi:Bacterial Ig-like domain